MSKSGFLDLRIKGLDFRKSDGPLSAEQQANKVVERLRKDHTRLVRFNDDQTKIEFYQRQRGEAAVRAEPITMDDLPEVHPESQIMRKGSDLRGKDLSITIRTPSGKKVRAEDIIGRSPQAAISILRSIDENRSLNLSILGRVLEVEKGGSVQEVLLGLRATTQVVSLIEEAGVKGFEINEYGLITNVTQGGAEKIINALNDKFKFGLSFFSVRAAVDVIRNNRPILSALGIRWIWAKNGERFQTFMIEQLNAFYAEPEQRDPWGGLVFGRIIAK